MRAVRTHGQGGPEQNRRMRREHSQRSLGRLDKVASEGQCPLVNRAWVALAPSKIQILGGLDEDSY